MLLPSFFADYADTFELLATILEAEILEYDPPLVRAAMFFICFTMFVKTCFAAVLLNENFINKSTSNAYNAGWIITRILFQDVPSFVLRAVIWQKYDEVNVYFIIKNGIFIALNIWRVVEILHKQAAIDEKDRVNTIIRVVNEKSAENQPLLFSETK